MTGRHIAPILSLLSGAVLALGYVPAAKGSTLYATSIVTNQILKVDTVTGSVVPILNSAGGVDSLVFDSAGRIIYSQAASGGVRRFDPATGIDELLAGGLLVPADLALEPGGNSVLVSQFGGGVISRIDLLTNALTTLGTYGGNPEGLAYDASGRLFANLGVRDIFADKYLAELDPITGAILQQSPGITSLDGLTYDSYTGQLFASLLFGNLVCRYNPDSLAAGPTFCHGVIPGPDGLTSDGLGNLFIAATGAASIYRYNIPTDTITQQTFVLGLDDLAPASGSGSAPSPVPEPGNFLLTATGLLIGGSWFRNRNRAHGGIQ